MSEDLLKVVCLGNQMAEAFCAAFWRFAHSVDDLIDRDNPSFTATGFVKNLAVFVLDLSLNPFFQQNKQSLLPIMVQSLIAWGDSMEWERSGDSRKVADSDVLKGWYHEVFYHVAFIVGGIDHAQMITKQHRSYDHQDRGSNYGIL